MPDYALNTNLTAKDRVSSTFKKMGREAERFGVKSSSAFRNASKAGYSFQAVVKGYPRC